MHQEMIAVSLTMGDTYYSVCLYDKHMLLLCFSLLSYSNYISYVTLNGMARLKRS